MKTFRQYVEDIHRHAASRHSISLAEARRELPDAGFRADWRDYIVKEFNQGATLSTRLWRSLDEGLQYRVLRTPRALRDNELTRRLRRQA